MKFFSLKTPLFALVSALCRKDLKKIEKHLRAGGRPPSLYFIKIKVSIPGIVVLSML